MLKVLAGTYRNRNEGDTRPTLAPPQRAVYASPGLAPPQ